VWSARHGYANVDAHLDFWYVLHIAIAIAIAFALTRYSLSIRL
jgi:hypothetical protein